MAKTPADRVRELEQAVTSLQERAEHARRDADEQRAARRDVEREQIAFRAENAELRQELALVRQRLDDHVKRYELWEARRWAFVMALVGAVLSLASGLIVTLARK